MRSTRRLGSLNDFHVKLDDEFAAHSVAVAENQVTAKSFCELFANVQPNPVRLRVRNSVQFTAAAEVRREKVVTVLIVEADARVCHANLKQVLVICVVLNVLNFHAYPALSPRKLDGVADQVDQNLL